MFSCVSVLYTWLRIMFADAIWVLGMWTSGAKVIGKSRSVETDCAERSAGASAVSPVVPTPDE